MASSLNFWNENKLRQQIKVILMTNIDVRTEIFYKFDVLTD
jgi:hypothetical protein